MITWNLTLSGNQINLLKMFAEREKWPHDEGPNARDNRFGVSGNSIPGTRTLVREGLLEHRMVHDRRGYMITDKSGHFITERGKFILQMIETDIDKFLSVENQAATKRGLKRSA